MFPPFCCGYGFEEGSDGRRRHQERKLRFLTRCRDAIERQLAAVNAAISKLEEQMQRDPLVPPSPRG